MAAPNNQHRSASMPPTPTVSTHDEFKDRQHQSACMPPNPKPSPHDELRDLFIHLTTTLALPEYKDAKIASLERTISLMDSEYFTLTQRIHILNGDFTQLNKEVNTDFDKATAYTESVKARVKVLEATEQARDEEIAILRAQKKALETKVGRFEWREKMWGKYKLYLEKHVLTEEWDRKEFSKLMEEKFEEFIANRVCVKKRAKEVENEKAKVVGNGRVDEKAKAVEKERGKVGGNEKASSSTIVENAKKSSSSTR